MKYYKIMTFENKFIGAVSSSDFIRYSFIGHSYMRCNEKKGEKITTTLCDGTIISTIEETEE